jgi:hypothetical protein
VTAQQKRSRWRGLARGSLIALALVAIGWQVAKRAIDVDHYRPRVEAALAEFTGLPVAIGSLALSWRRGALACLRTTCRSAKGDFHAVAARLDVFPRLWPLLRSRGRDRAHRAGRARDHLPPARADLESQWRSLLAHVEAARGKPSLPAIHRPA